MGIIPIFGLPTPFMDKTPTIRALIVEDDPMSAMALQDILAANFIDHRVDEDFDLGFHDLDQRLETRDRRLKVFSEVCCL